MDGTDLLDTNSAAARLGVAVATLRRWRKSGDGPAWIRVGRRLVKYQRGALEAYLGRGSDDRMRTPPAQAGANEAAA